MDKTILITGAAGFLGRHLAEGLSLKNRVLACSRHDLNVSDAEEVNLYWKKHPKIDLVIHCATTGGRRTTSYDEGRGDVVDQNLRMFFNLARCLRTDQRMIHFGSGAEYDRAHYKSKMTEEYFDQYVPSDSYGFAKSVISKFIAKMDNVLCLRVFGVYGKYDDYRYKFISNAVIKGLLGLPITVAQNVVFDYLFIEDFVLLVERLLFGNWPYRHINITPSKSVDLVTLAKIVNEVTGNKAGIKVLNPGWNIEYTGSNSRLMETVGPHEFKPYQEGIRALTEYYRFVWDSLDLDTVRADPFISKCIVRR